MKSALVLATAVLGAIAAPASAQADEPADFLRDARLFYRVVACGGSDPLPAGIDAATVDAHCAEMTRRYQHYTEKYVAPARAFFAPLRPANLATVVYPFGGGDLGSALVTFPDAREITTISLEHAGDPTRLAKLDKKELRGALSAYRDASHGLLALYDSTSENMRKLERGGIPGQLSFHITGMTALGFEPVSLKFVSLEPDGQVHYLTAAEIEALAPRKAKKVKGGWVDTDFSEAYNNMELTFRKAGDPSAPLIVHRHFAANLANRAFKDSPLDKHLIAKGKFAAMTKAASYLLWLDGFSEVRNLLLSHMVWMASDATGIPPTLARKAGFAQVTYGKFTGPFLAEAEKTNGEAMVKLWASQPVRKLPFRYGYPDAATNVHLMITQPAEPRPAQPAEPPKPAQPAEPKPAQPAEPKPAQPAEPKITQPAEPKPSQPAPPRAPQPAEPQQPAPPKTTQPAQPQQPTPPKTVQPPQPGPAQPVSPKTTQPAQPQQPAPPRTVQPPQPGPAQPVSPKTTPPAEPSPAQPKPNQPAPASPKPTSPVPAPPKTTPAPAPTAPPKPTPPAEPKPPQPNPPQPAQPKPTPVEPKQP